MVIHLIAVHLTGMCSMGLYLIGVRMSDGRACHWCIPHGRACHWREWSIVRFSAVGVASVSTTGVIDDMVKSDGVSIVE